MQIKSQTLVAIDPRALPYDESKQSKGSSNRPNTTEEDNCKEPCEEAGLNNCLNRLRRRRRRLLPF